MNTDSAKQDLMLNLLESKEYREAYTEEHVYTTVAFQIAALREQRGLSQMELGKLARMAQERISILEDPNAETKPTLKTLLRLAAAFDCGLEVRLVPFGELVDNAFRSSPEELRVPAFEDQMRQPEAARKVRNGRRAGSRTALAPTRARRGR